MGKVRNRRKNRVRNRPNPVGIPSVQELLEHEDDEVPIGGQSESTFVQTILEQLRSHTVEERDSGLNSLASSCSNRAILEELLKHHDIIKIVGPMLSDHSRILRHSAAGALRNISAIGSEVCDFMVSQGIMTHLVLLFRQHFAGEWEPHKKGKKHDDASTNGTERIDTLTETFIQAVNLLWNICESNDTALSMSNRNKLEIIIGKGLDVDKYGVLVAIASAQCLNTMTEDNKSNFPELLCQFEILLQRILQSELPSDNSFGDWIYLQTLCTGILLNLHNGEILKLSSANIRLLLQIISSSLGVDHVSELKKFSSEIPVTNNDDGMETNHGTIHNAEEVDPKILHSLERSANHIANLLSAQMAALETLSNILFVDDDESDGDDDDSGESIVEGMEEDVDQSDKGIEGLPCGVISEVLEGLNSHQIVQKVLTKAVFPPVNVLQIVNDSSFKTNIPETLIQLRCRALICYQNIATGLDLNDLGGIEKTKQTWYFLGELLKASLVEHKMESKDACHDELEAVTSAMRAIAQKWVDENCVNLLDIVQSGSFDLLVTIQKSVEVAKIQTNIIKIFGSFGVLMVRQKWELTNLYLPVIGGILLSYISSSKDGPHLWITAEALDTIFDVFSEDDYKNVENDIQLVEKLRLFLPQFKKLIKMQRRELGENKAVIDTARINLSRFIEYKMKIGCV